MDHRFSALWLRSKFSICSYQLLSGTIPLWEHRYYSDFGTWRSARGLLHLCRGSGRYCSTSGFGPLKNDLFPLQFAFNFWSSFLKEDFPFRPSGNRGSGSFVSYPQSSMLFRQPRRSRGSKNARRGGGGKATHVSQPATRGAASRDLKASQRWKFTPWSGREER